MTDQIFNNPGGTHEPRRVARLTWSEGGQAMEKDISTEGLTIGRGSENDLVIRDLEASRFHCKILPENENLLVVDLDSTNGTSLNGDRISGSRQLHGGDRISIGQVEFVVELLPQEPVQVPPVVEEMPLEKTLIVPPASKLPRFIVSSGVGRGTEFSLMKERMLIGRASSSQKWDIDLVDKSVSRPHAEVVKKDGDWVLTDLNSANGTRVNGTRVTAPCPLQHGDTVACGETTLIFRLVSGE